MSEITKQSDQIYLKDGLIWCGKCNTPRQVRLTFLGRESIVSCLCDCQIERQMHKEKWDTIQRNWRLMDRLGLSLPKRELSKWSFDNADESNTVALNYVEGWDTESKGLLIYGGVGTGKTFMAGCIFNALMRKGVPCLMTSTIKLAGWLWNVDDREDRIQRLNQFKMLIIDDLGAERDTEWMTEMVHEIIDVRYMTRLPLIVTTNMTAEEIKHPADIKKERLISRLLEICVPYEMKGKDKRKRKLINENKKDRERLGMITP